MLHSLHTARLHSALHHIPLSGMSSLQGKAKGVMECWHTKAVRLPAGVRANEHLKFFTCCVLSQRISETKLPKAKPLYCGCDPKFPEIIRSQVSKEVDQGTCGIFLAHPSLCKYELPVLLKEEDTRVSVYPEDYERLSFTKVGEGSGSGSVLFLVPEGWGYTELQP